jgi:hypothetical protein
VIATSDFCNVAALAYGDQVLSFQGHPEFNEAFVGALIEDRREVVLDDDVADKGAASLGAPIDRDAIGAGIVSFLKGRESEWKQKKATKA